MKPKPLSVPACLLLIFTSVHLSASAGIVSGHYQCDSQNLWNFEQSPGLKGPVGEVEMGGDRDQFVLNYDFEKGGEYVSASTDLAYVDPAIEVLTGVHVFVWGPGGPLDLAIVDATDQVFTYPLGMVKDDTQHSFETTLESPASVSGGAGDKVMHYPLKLVRFVVRNVPPFTKGKVAFERISLKGPQFEGPPEPQ